MGTVKIDPWTRKKKSYEVTRIIAERLIHPEKIKEIVLKPNNVSTLGKHHPWEDLSLSHGYPATVLLFAELDRLEPEEGWDRLAHQHLLAIQNTLEKEGFKNVSLFSGLTGVAFAAQAASRYGERYQGLLKHLHTLIVREQRKLLEKEKERRAVESGVYAQWYDIIVGITGVGRYLLSQKEDPDLGALLVELLQNLVELTQPIKVQGKMIPGWYIPQKAQFLEKDKIAFPNGNFNVGLAHGIPGPLALLSLAKAQGVEVPGQKEAIQRIVEWLLRWKQEDEHGPFWYDRVSWEEETGESKRSNRHREAWCYGTPGVARALYLAGQALGDQKVKEVAVQAYHSIFLRPEMQWDIDSPTFCHGTAGLLEMTRRMWKDTQDSRFLSYLERLVYRQLKDFNPELPFGYQDLEPLPVGYRGLNKVGLLEGAVGVALALLSVYNDEFATWSQAFLLH